MLGYITKTWRLVYDDPDDSAKKAAEVLKKAEDDLKAAGKIITTQDDLNKMMAENRRKLTQQNQELVKQLEELRNQSNLTQQQREELEQRINTLQEQFMTKEEIAKKESVKQSKAFEDEKKRIAQEANSWRERYTNETVRRSITDASVEGKAVSPEQIVAILGASSYLGEVLDAAGKPTGNYEPRVKFNDVDSEGKPVILELTPTQAVKRMKELPEKFGNLFVASGSGGVGGAGNASRGTPTTLDSLKDLDSYKKFRSEHPDLDLSKVQKK
jgi:hypothetical protein